MAWNKRRDDIDITREELNQISEAMKKEEFRKLFVEYVEEINDPANKALFEKEVTQYEKERGIDITFVHPKPGFVVKTSVDGAKKGFINVCKNDKIGKPIAARGVQEGSSGIEWSLPYIQTPPRDDVDKNKQFCVVFDVIFHPLTLELAERDARFKQFVTDTALTAVESSFDVVLDRNNLKFPKMAFKGYKHPCVIRKKINGNEMPGPSEKMDDDDDDPLEAVMPSHYYPYSEPVEDPTKLTPKCNKNAEKDLYTTPKYLIKHRKNLDLQEFTYSQDSKLNSCVSNELLIEIHLPLIRSVSDVELLLSERTLSLKTESPAKYKLTINLPYSIVEDESSAKFDGSKRRLIVTAVVDMQKHCLNREDSGLESDPNRGLSSSSDEDITKEDSDNTVIAACDKSNTVSINSSSNITGNIKDVKGNINCLPVHSNDDVMETEADPFLNPDHYYSVPNYKLNKTAIGISVSLTVINIDPSSVCHIFSESNSLFHVKFYSMGLGFVKINYALCLKLKATSFNPSSLNVDVWNDFINISISVKERNTCALHSMFVGSDLLSLKEKPLPELSPTNSEVSLKDIGGICEDPSTDNNDVKQSGDIVLKLSKLRLYSMAQDDSDDCDDENLELSSPESNIAPYQKAVTSDYSTKKPSSSPIKIDKKIRRTFSESGSPIPVIQRRSILKNTRSLSESSAHDYSIFSMSMESEDGYENQENTHVKKHVRFSETISKKVFRANSSILGQRKKNQRKAKNKKKSIERRNSESSGISESEVSELEVSEVSDLSEVSDVSETSESDDGSNVDSKSTPQTPGSKSHRRKGKKNHRKSANTAKIHVLDNEA